MKVCVIGCGGHTFRAYLPSLLRCCSEMPFLELGGCCDIDREKAKMFAERCGFPRWYTDSREMLTYENPDAVILVTPYRLTAQFASEILQKGIAVLMEKPPAADYSSYQNLVSVARECDVLHQVAFNRRHFPIIRALNQQLQNTPIQHIDYYMYRVNRRESGFYSTAVHGIDLVCFLAHSPCISADFTYARLPQYGEGVKNILARLIFQNGITANLTFCPVSDMVSEGLTLVADHRTFKASLPIWSEADTGKLIVWENGQQREITASDGKSLFESNGFYRQLSVFLNHVHQQIPGQDDLMSAADTMKLMECLKNEVDSYYRKRIKGGTT